MLRFICLELVIVLNIDMELIILRMMRITEDVIFILINII